MKSLLVGCFSHGTDINRKIDDNTILFDTPKKQSNLLYSFITKTIYKLTGYFFNLENFNKNLLTVVLNEKPDVVIFHKNLSLLPKTIELISTMKIKCILYVHDYIQNPVNHSKNFINALKHFDTIITTKSYEVDFLKKISKNQNVIFINNWINQSINNKGLYYKHDQVSDEIIVVSGYEFDRMKSIYFLAKNNIKVKVFCGNELETWKKNRLYHPNINYVEKFLIGKEYKDVISQSFLIISFLRKANLDKQTSRSIEVLYYGGILLTYRTNEHLNMFVENKEAIYFDSDLELLEKINLLKKNKEFYNSIKLNGMKKVQKFNEKIYINIVNEAVK